MRKIKIISITLLSLLMINIVSLAAIDQTINFDIIYQGSVKVNEEKNATIILEGNNTPLHSNVRVKVDIEGPEKPKILATDSLGTEIDIAKEGYWGPAVGFTIGGTFKNETPIRATFTKAGTYTISLNLLDVQNNNDILAGRVFKIEVVEDTPTVNEIINNPTEELPKTGTSLIEYVIYATILFVIIYVVYQISRRKN